MVRSAWAGRLLALDGTLRRQLYVRHAGLAIRHRSRNLVRRLLRRRRHGRLDGPHMQTRFCHERDLRRRLRRGARRRRILPTGRGRAQRPAVGAAANVARVGQATCPATPEDGASSAVRPRRAGGRTAASHHAPRRFICSVSRSDTLANSVNATPPTGPARTFRAGPRAARDTFPRLQKVWNY
jgi:hypothetical protein